MATPEKAKPSEPAADETQIQRLERELAELKSLLINKLLNAPAPVAPARSEDQTLMEKIYMKRLREEEEAKAKFKKDELWSCVDSVIRTQVAANNKFTDGEQIWAIKLGKDHPQVYIRGHSQHECHARYDDICFILGVKRDEKHPEWTAYVETNVSNDAAARELVGMDEAKALTLPPTPKQKWKVA